MDIQGPASGEGGAGPGAGAGPSIASCDTLALLQSAEGAVLDRSLHPSGILPTLQNIVATVELGVKLDLKAIALGARNAEYNPKRFPAVIIRIRNPKCTALLFASGNMVVTGTKSEDSARQAARKFAKSAARLGLPSEVKDLRVRNIVASCDVKFPIRLEGLACTHQLLFSYEPELPGLIYWMKQAKSGPSDFCIWQGVLAGAKTERERERGNSTCPFSQHWLMRTCPCLSHLPN